MSVVQRVFCDIHNNRNKEKASSEWKEFISQQPEPVSLHIGNSYTAFNINCSGWDFEKVNLIFSGHSQHSADFSNCTFKSLTTSTNNRDRVVLDKRCNFSNSTFLEDVDINVNVKSEGIIFDNAKFLSPNKNKIAIQANSNSFDFNNVEFGAENRESQEIELNLSSNPQTKNPIDISGIKFFAKKVLFKTNYKNLNFTQLEFRKDSELCFEGEGNEHISIKFEEHIFDNQKKITFKNIGIVHGEGLILNNCNSLELDKSNLRAKEISLCEITGQKRENNDNVNVHAELISESIFKTKVHIQNDKDNSLIKKSNFEQDVSIHNVNDKCITEIISCTTPNLRINGGKYKITKSKNISTITGVSYLEINDSEIDKIEGDRILHFEVNNSKIENLIINSTQHLDIKNTTITKSKFTECHFSSCALFSNVTFEESPIVDNIAFSNCNVDFRDVNFKCKEGGVAIGFFRALVKVCSEAGYEHGVIFFHALELETYYNNHLKKISCFSKNGVEKISSKIHKLFTEYGTNLKRPLMWLFGFFLLGIYVNNIECVNFVIGNLFSKNLELNILKTFKDLTSLPFHNSLGPLVLATKEKFDLGNGSFWIQFYNFFHIIFSSVIWFLLIFMIRRRFKI